MKKPSFYILLLCLATLIIVVGATLRIMHVISSGIFQLTFAASLLLYFIARRSKDKSKNHNA